MISKFGTLPRVRTFILECIQPISEQDTLDAVF